MSNYFFDTYSIIEIIKEKESYKKFKESTFITNTLDITEVCYYLCENIGIDKVDEIISKLNFIFLPITKEIAVEASKFRFKNKKLKLSYADCIGYVCAKENELLFLTGDDGFKDIENVEFVK